MNIHAAPTTEVERLELLTLIRDQSYETLDVKARITCPGCKRKVPVRSAYHCFFCGLWLCHACAAVHFGPSGKAREMT